MDDELVEGGNIWANPTPEKEKSLDDAVPESGRRSLDGEDENGHDPTRIESETTTTTTTGTDVNNDDDAWNASPDDSQHAEGSFVDAASKLSLSRDLQPAETLEDDDERHREPEAGPSSPARTRAGDKDTIDDALQEPDDGEFDDDDGFGDFGEPAQGENGADDDDFGAFDEAGDVDDFGDSEQVDFDQAPSQPVAGPSTSTAASTSTFNPFASIDYSLVGTDASQVAPYFLDAFTRLWPDWQDSLDRSAPMPENEGINSILVTDELREKYRDWIVDEPVHEPYDWRRSSIRRQVLQQLGVPINLDDVAPASRPLPSLVLPSIRTTPASPNINRHTPSGQFKSIPPRSNGSTLSRNASPSSQRPQTPSIDFDRARALADLPESEMSFRTLKELEALQKEIQDVAIQASTHLTTLLERKEILSGQSETYNAMIQDLAREAQKMKSPGASTSGATGRKPSLKRSTSATNRERAGTAGNSASTSPVAQQASSAATASRSIFGHGSSSSRPNSRPSSPASVGHGSSNLKSSVSRSSAGAGAEQHRRSSLW